jgi:nucleotide-binding universal stress UspA family protein
MDRSTPTRILALADSDQASVTAVGRAAGLAVALGAELVLLAVVPPALADARYSSALMIVPEELAGNREEVERTLARRRGEFADVVPPAVRSHWVHGHAPAGEAIINAVDEVDADLVVVPMHRGAELSHLLRDGTDRYVLHHSPVPVLVVPAA